MLDHQAAIDWLYEQARDAVKESRESGFCKALRGLVGSDFDIDAKGVDGKTLLGRLCAPGIGGFGIERTRGMPEFMIPHMQRAIDELALIDRPLADAEAARLVRQAQADRRIQAGLPPR